jgi:hypothetical protein
MAVTMYSYSYSLHHRGSYHVFILIFITPLGSYHVFILIFSSVRAETIETTEQIKTIMDVGVSRV